MEINPPLSPFIKGEGMDNLVPLLDKGGARGGFVFDIETLKNENVGIFSSSWMFLVGVDSIRIIYLLFFWRDYMLKIDTHFHPNFSLFSRRLIRQRAKKIWKKFEEIGLDFVIVTEHAFKSPAKQYHLLKQYRPLWAKTQLIPGIEALTKEWIDMIVFAKTEDIYSYEEIITPKYFTLFELLDFVGKHQWLYTVVTHPFNISDTAITRHYNEAVLKKAIQQCGFVEKYNACWYSFQLFLEKWNMQKYFPKIYQKMLFTGNVPVKYYDENVCVLWWSDAHHPEYLWDYLILETENKIFESIVDSKIKRSMFFKERRWYLLRYLLVNWVTVSIEWLMKRFWLY